MNYIIQENSIIFINIFSISFLNLFVLFYNVILKSMIQSFSSFFKNNKPIVITGVQPTNKLHIGNYLGAIRQIIELQEENNILLFIADMHALTSQKFPFNNLSLDLAATYIACGVDPEKVVIFKQSDVGHYHSFLSWILSCFCPRGMLNKMVQMKDKSKNYGDFLGIYEYPVLMAADILLYNADLVPVGDDQQQHLELVRMLGRKINEHLKENFFQEPKHIKNPNTCKILSLRNTNKKMSKSGEENDVIFIEDSAEDIERKIKKAKTDNLLFPSNNNDITENNRYEINNLINIYQSFSQLSKDEIFEKFGNKYISEFKNDLILLLQKKLQRFNDKKKQLLIDPTTVISLLEKNAENVSFFLKGRMKILKEKFF